MPPQMRSFLDVITVFLRVITKLEISDLLRQKTAPLMLWAE